MTKQIKVGTLRKIVNNNKKKIDGRQMFCPIIAKQAYIRKICRYTILFLTHIVMLNNKLSVTDIMRYLLCNRDAELVCNLFINMSLNK